MLQKHERDISPKNERKYQLNFFLLAKIMSKIETS